jgi:hypothetical protein
MDWLLVSPEYNIRSRRARAKSEKEQCAGAPVPRGGTSRVFSQRALGESRGGGWTGLPHERTLEHRARCNMGELPPTSSTSGPSTELRDLYEMARYHGICFFSPRSRAQKSSVTRPKAPRGGRDLTSSVAIVDYFVTQRRAEPRDLNGSARLSVVFYSPQSRA